MGEKNGGKRNQRKYIIEFDFEIDGTVELSDIVGAIFSSTDYLLGPDFDMREMSETGKISRIRLVNVETRGRKMIGTLQVPTTKEIEAVALIAALIETVEQVGPYKAKFKFKRIIDVREEKLRYIEKRAMEILEKWKFDKIPKADEILRKLHEKALGKVNLHNIKVGNTVLVAGPEFEKADEVILVEGRADVAKLVKFGIKNVLSIGGGKIPEELKNILENKRVVAFLDGDRGGFLNLKKLMNTIRVDYVAMAPKGKEVEELKYEEVMEALANRQPIDAFMKEGDEELQPYKEYINQVSGKMEALLIKNGSIVQKVSVSDLMETLEKLKDTIDLIVTDGIITQRLVDLAKKKGVKVIVGVRSNVGRIPEDMKILHYGEGA